MGELGAKVMHSAPEQAGRRRPTSFKIGVSLYQQNRSNFNWQTQMADKFLKGAEYLHKFLPVDDTTES